MCVDKKSRGTTWMSDWLWGFTRYVFRQKTEVDIVDEHLILDGKL